MSSTSSSIFDLSGECEQLERAIRDNDVTAVKKFLQIHHAKFPVDLAASILDKSSCDSRSRRYSHVSQDVEILLLKSQTLIESFDRRESINTESDVPGIFRTSLHLAVQHGADEVLKLLLKFGVDPNEPSVHVSFPAASRRYTLHPLCLLFGLRAYSNSCSILVILHTVLACLLFQTSRNQSAQMEDASYGTSIHSKASWNL